MLQAAQVPGARAWPIARIRDLYSGLRYGPRPGAGDLSRLKHLVNRLRT